MKNQLKKIKSLFKHKLKFNIIHISLLMCFLFSLIYYFSNLYLDNIIIQYVANNILIQSIMLFSTIVGIINVFFTLTLQKQINEQDIIRLAKEQQIKDKEREILEKNIEQEATF